MPRDAKKKESREAKTPAIRKTLEFTDHLYRKLCNESVFPKRSRWLFGGKIADLCGEFSEAVFTANEIKVCTQKERDERHYQLTMAIAKLLALDAKVTQAGRVLDIPPNTLELYAGYVNECRNLLQAWMRADDRKYGKATSIIQNTDTRYGGDEPRNNEGNGQ